MSVNPTFIPSNTSVSPSNIWYDDCSDPNNWLFENTSTLNIDWRVEYDPNATPAGGALTPMASATASNGFMFVNSDADGGSTDNEHCKLAWRREHQDLNKLDQWSFADTEGTLVDALGIRSEEGVALRATFIVDPHNIKI